MTISYVTPMTELEAVNELLAAIGEAPITSLDDAAEQSPDATVAQARLATESKSIQSKGYPWNTDLCYPLTPNVAGELQLPSGAVSADITDDVYSYRGRFVMRGGRIYDRVAHTFIIDSSFDLTADIIVLLEFEDLPHPARDLIVKRAVRAFQHQIQGEAANYRFTTDDIEKAEAILEDASGDQGDFNMLTGDATTRRIAFRNRGGR